MRDKKEFVIKILKVLWAVYVVASIAVLLPKVDQLLTRNYASVSEYVDLDEAWEVTINGDSYRDVVLRDFQFPAVGRGDQITMTRMLPEEWGIAEGVLRLYTRHAAVRVYIDDDMVYEYGHDRMIQNKTVGSGYQFVNFPEEYGGKRLTVQLSLAEDKAFTKLNSVRIYAWENAFRVLMTENRLPLFLGSFLTIFGFTVCVITAFALMFSRKYIRLLCISIFSICMGLWTLCYYRVLLVFSIPLYSIALIQYVSLYLGPVPLIAYMYEDVKNLGRRFFKVAYWALLGAYVVALKVMISLHTRDIVHLASMLQYVVTFMVFSLLFFSIVIILNFKSGKTVNRMQLAGMLIIVICILYDLFGYGNDRYYGNSSFLMVKGVTSLGVLAFIFILLISFYIEMTQKMMQENERLFLIKSAYTDELTQLHNRRYCMEYMNKLREERVSDYTVICFDLNNLKKVNDTCGHAKGDILIRSAAEVLAETFGEHGIVARMGGDEFIAVVNTADPGKVAALMGQLQANIEKKNRQEEGLGLSIACGCASGGEYGKDIEKVYQAADDRMYEHKRQMKEAARGREGLSG